VIGLRRGGLDKSSIFSRLAASAKAGATTKQNRRWQGGEPAASTENQSNPVGLEINQPWSPGECPTS